MRGCAGWKAPAAPRAPVSVCGTLGTLGTLGGLGALNCPNLGCGNWFWQFGVNRDREGAGDCSTRSLTVAVHQKARSRYRTPKPRVSVFGVGAFHAASKAQ